MPTHAVGFGMGLSPISWSVRLSPHVALRLVGGLIPIVVHDSFALFQSLGLGFDFFVKGANLRGLYLGVHFQQTWTAGCDSDDCEMLMLTLGPRLLIGYRWQFDRTFLSLEGGIQYVYFKRLYDDEYADDSWAWPMPHIAFRGGFLK